MESEDRDTDIEEGPGWVFRSRFFISKVNLQGLVRTIRRDKDFNIVSFTLDDSSAVTSVEVPVKQEDSELTADYEELL